MLGLRFARIALLAAAVGGVLCASQAHAPAAIDLYAQATAVMLDHEFSSSRVEYFVVDLQSGQTLATRWPHEDRPVPVGSLMKPFIALAWGQNHSPREFPVVLCHGRSDGCWRPSGHGSVSLEQALSVSCNAYFLSLGRELLKPGVDGLAALDQVSTRYGLPAPPRDATPETLIGLTPEWRVEPRKLAFAYAQLVTENSEPAHDRLLRGLELAAQPRGTASLVGTIEGGVLAKTGTAPCVDGDGFERCLASGDGLAVVMYPLRSPRLLILVRKRGTTGAQAARVAGDILRRIAQTREGAVAWVR